MQPKASLREVLNIDWTGFGSLSRLRVGLNSNNELQELGSSKTVLMAAHQSRNNPTRSVHMIGGKKPRTSLSDNPALFYEMCKGKVKSSLDMPRGFQEVEVPRFQDNRHIKMVRLTALHTGRLYPQKDGFSGLVVSMLASGTQGCGFKPGRSRWIFRT